MENRFAFVARELGQLFAERARAHDREGSFVADNFADLKAAKMFSALVPKDLGGGGANYGEICDVIRLLGQQCGSTALAFSMHTHLVAANVFKHHKGQTPPILSKVAANELVLISTGAGDWVSSNGSARRVQGGFRVSGRKIFCSGSPAGDVFVTSIRFEEEGQPARVLHLPVPAKAEGVRILDDWDTLGMRGTGSQSVVFDEVFVPAEAVALERKAEGWHPVWNVVATVAPPVYMSAYLGIAEGAAERALERARLAPQRTSASLVGELNNALTQAQLAFADMVRLIDDFRFEPSNALSSAQLTRKTLVAKASKRTVELSCELAGGQSFFRSSDLERATRDIQAAHFHPLPERRQHVFSGLVALGQDPSAA